MAIKNIFGRGIGFGGPQWITTRGYSQGVVVVDPIMNITVTMTHPLGIAATLTHPLAIAVSLAPEE